MGTFLPITALSSLSCNQPSFSWSCRSDTCSKSAGVVAAPRLRAGLGPFPLKIVCAEEHPPRRTMSIRTVRKSPNIASCISGSTCRFDLLSRTSRSRYTNRRYQRPSSQTKTMANSLFTDYPFFFRSLIFPLVENDYEGNLALVMHWSNSFIRIRYFCLLILLPLQQAIILRSYRYVECPTRGQAEEKGERALWHLYQQSWGFSAFHQIISENIQPPFRDQLPH